MKQKKTYIRSISTRGRYADGDTHKTATSRYTGERAILYAKGGAVAVSRAGSAAYLGTDMLGSVRSVTDSYGAVESYRDYDIFGTPYGDAAASAASTGAGAFAGGVDFGYAGKPYDAATGMYNYGFRDYAPMAARFTTLDPIRDGRNWFAYVNGDPVNFVDLWGLSSVDLKQGVNIAPSQASIIRNINNNSNLSYNSPFAIGIKIDDTAPMVGSIEHNNSNHVNFVINRSCESIFSFSDRSKRGLDTITFTNTKTGDSFNLNNVQTYVSYFDKNGEPAYPLDNTLEAFSGGFTIQYLGNNTSQGQSLYGGFESKYQGPVFNVQNGVTKGRDITNNSGQIEGSEDTDPIRVHSNFNLITNQEVPKASAGCPIYEYEQMNDFILFLERNDITPGTEIHGYIKEYFAP